VPVWHERTKTLTEQGKLLLVSVVPEQHGERTRLFMQWKQMSWPTLVDPLNLLGVPLVPISLALDENGVIRLVQPMLGPLDDLLEFVATKFEPPRESGEAPAPAAAELGAAGGDAALWRSRGDRLVRAGDEKSLGRAIEAYERALSLDGEDPVLWFRLGVAHRMRYDSKARRPEDFQRAVGAWSRSLALDPNDYIVRRRLQQYGPRLDKPYPFYEWVHVAREEIAARGETPLPLKVEPAGSELAGKLRTFPRTEEPPVSPDPDGRITRDDKKLIVIESTVVPWPAEPGGPLRVHLVLRPSVARDAHWNNEVGPLRVWLDPPDGWSIDSRLIEVRPGEGATSVEIRRVETELQAPEAGAREPASLRGFALYYVCEGVQGRCLYRRQDVVVPLTSRATRED